MSEKNVLVVLGMHRSGTSALTELLSNNGYNPGKSDVLLGADPSNQRGHFEYLPLLEFNESLLNALNTTWWNPPEDLSVLNLMDFKSEAVRIWREARKLEINLFKEPRLSVLLPFWIQIWRECDELGNIKFLRIFRDPYNVAQSLNARNGFPTYIGEIIWLKYNLKILEDSKRLDTLDIDFEKLISREAINKKLEDFCGNSGIEPETLISDLVNHKSTRKSVFSEVNNLWEMIGNNLVKDLNPSNYISEYKNDYSELLKTWNTGLMLEQARTEAEQARTEAEQARTEAEQARTEANKSAERYCEKQGSGCDWIPI